MQPSAPGSGGVRVGCGGVGASGWGGELEVAGGGLGEGPAGELLDLVVAAAVAAEVAGAGRAALVVGGGVVEVGVAGGLAAAGVAAGLVAGGDVVADVGGGPVGGGGGGVGAAAGRGGVRGGLTQSPRLRAPGGAENCGPDPGRGAGV